MTAAELDLLVAHWLDGFAVSRGLTLEDRGAITEVEIQAGGRRIERVLTEPDAATLDAAFRGLIGTDDVWLTVFTATPLDVTVPEGVRVVLGVEVLMTTDLPRVPAPSHLRALVTDEGQRARATVTEGDVTAAAGQVAVVDDLAVFDRIGTHEDHRRRGLGTDVMAALAGWAHDRGARRGALAASVEGQALYARLGWQVAARMTSFSGSCGSAAP